MPAFLRPLVLVCSVFLGGSIMRAQNVQDTIHLKEAVVLGIRSNGFASGIKVQTIDSAALARYRSMNLGDLLGNETPIFIKSYGLGSLATTSFRGGSASHTAILWNGFHISSPMNGQLDLSLVPMHIANSVSLQYGGTSALWGSGAVGGTVLLNNVPEFNQGLHAHVGVSLGSFGDRRQDAGIRYSTARSVTFVQLNHATARNDFGYYNTEVPGAPLRTQTNAGLEQFGVLAENHFRINDRQQMNVRFWYQSSDRNIPPTMLQASSAAKQQDASYRVTSEWQRTGAKVKTSVRAAYFDEQLRWFAFADELSSLSRSQNVIAEAEAKVHLTADQTINVGVNNTFAQAVSDGYPDRPQQNRTALFGSYQLNALRKRLLSTLSARQELIGAKLVPFTFSLGSEYVCTNWLTTKANVSKVYRVPTFNDLYWKPGGNPELLPESGFSGDVGLAAKWVPTGKRYTLTAEVTAFHRRIENWIIWLPGPSYWSPQNIMNVWSRGIESRSEVGVRMRKALVKVGVMTNYVVSTNEQAKTMNDASVGKQLIYVPMYSGSAKLSIMYKAFSATYMMTYTGYRYTSTDNRQFLEPYTLANAAIAYELKPGRRYKVSLLAQAFNLFDEAYEVMLSRPMPLSNYQFGVRVNFDQPLKRNPLPQ